MHSLYTYLIVTDMRRMTDTKRQLNLNSKLLIETIYRCTILCLDFFCLKEKTFFNFYVFTLSYLFVGRGEVTL